MFLGFHEVTAYTASKAGVAGLTRSLAVEWGPRGVLVNAIAPGVFVTPLNRAVVEGTPRGAELLMRTPLGRSGALEETTFEPIWRLAVQGPTGGGQRGRLCSSLCTPPRGARL